MSNDDEHKQVPDSLTMKDEVEVLRYKSAKGIREISERGQYVEAFAHAQLGIEKILRDKIMGLSSGEKAVAVRRSIDSGNDQGLYTGTFELIKWACFLGAINNTEFNDLRKSNSKRNALVHAPGEWFYPEKHVQALERAIRFLENNGF